MKFKNVTIDSITQMIEDAPTEQKSAVIAEAIQKFVDEKYNSITEQYQREFLDFQSQADESSKFGLRSLDNEEMSFYDGLINQTLTGKDAVLLPVKTVNYVFEDLKLTHPLFQYLDFAPAGLEKWILSEYTGKSVWGKITAAITAEVEAEIKELDLGTNMISAFMYIPKGILDLGHKWVDKFVREVLNEVLSDGIEEGFVVGNGKDAPIGMNRDLAKPVTEGVYQERDAVAINDFGPDSFNVLALPTLNRSGKRNVDLIIVVANQNEIDTTIFKATHVKGGEGYVKAALPKKFVFVPSRHMPAGKALAFLPKRYRCGLTRLGIDTSKDYKFLERLVTYAIVGYGNGRFVANDDAVLLDITGLEPLVPTVYAIGKTDTEEDLGA